jgi:hypothetical protein
MLTAYKSYALHFQELCSTTFKICFSCYPHGVAFSVVVDLCSRQACSSGVARQFRARCQAELLHLDRSFGRTDLPSPLPSFAVANLQKIIEGCNSDLQILTLEKMAMWPKALPLETCR